MRFAYVGALLGAALVIGCGGDDNADEADRYEGEEAEVAAIIDTFAEAGRDGDGERVCEEVFAVPLAENIERESGQDCAAEVTENIPEDEYELSIDSLEAEDETATVTVTDQDDNTSVLHMVKSGDDWRVVRVTD